MGIVRGMTSLHISHTVRDLDEWLATFRSFDDFRAQGGVRATGVRHGVEDPNLVAVDLEFDTPEQARSFLRRLETEIWPNSPHIDSTPAVLLLESVSVAVS
jgi:hypothetical protein